MRGTFNQNYLTKEYDGPNTFKWEVLPVKRNMLFVRFENMGDKFDAKNGGTDTSNSTYYVKVQDFAKNLYTYVNGAGAKLNNINVWETSLTGNQKYSDMVKSKTKWVGEDDGKIQPPKLPSDKPNLEIALPR